MATLVLLFVAIALILCYVYRPSSANASGQGKRIKIERRLRRGQNAS